MIKKLFATLLTSIFISSCGSGGNTASNACNQGTPPSQPTESNSSQLMVGCGFNGNGTNVPYITVKICKPGVVPVNTEYCQVIDHVMIDTGSFGLKINQSALSGDFTSSLPTLNDIHNNPVYTCAQYGSGYMFGSDNYADIYISGEKSSNMPIQIINDGNQSNLPIQCTSTGKFNNLANYGAKAILGINPSVYLSNDFFDNFTYTNGQYQLIMGSSDIIESINVNPIIGFKTDNNGMIFNLPPAASNQNVNLYGTITFGLNTQANNIINATKVISNTTGGQFYAQNISPTEGEITEAIIDTGTNGFMFNSDLRLCQRSNIYCPNTPTSWVTQAFGVNSLLSPINITQQISNSQGKNQIAPFMGMARPNSQGIIYGMPFLFGKTIFMSFESTQTALGTGPSVGWISNN